MKNISTINEAAKYFNVPKATLLYWEKEGLIQFERATENNYRKFTSDTLFQIELVLHLRNLGIPIETIKKAPQMSLEERCHMYEHSIATADDKIRLLQDIKYFAQKQLEQIQEVTVLKSHPYQTEQPDFQYLVVHSKDSVYMESTDTGRFVLLIPELDNWDGLEAGTYTEASISDTKDTSSLIWELPQENTVWKTFLLDIIKDGNKRKAVTLPNHLSALRQLGFHPHSLVAHYLCEGVEDGILHIYLKAYVNVS